MYKSENSESNIDMQFETATSPMKSLYKEVWVEKEVYVELEGDRIRFYK
jgi:hypothetical protein